MKKQTKLISCCCYVSKRHTLALLLCLGFATSIGIRSNVGVVLVKMAQSPELRWGPQISGLVNASFFWGYVVTQIPGGFLAAKHKPTKLFGAALLMTSTVNLLLPLATRVSPYLVIVCRVFQGLVEGVTFPCCHGIWSKWAPPLERSSLATLSFCGTYFGALLGLPFSGILADTLGWQAPYLAYGFSGLLWGCLWFLVAYDEPRDHPTITNRELKYIEDSLKDSKGSQQRNNVRFGNVPWKSIFTSLPVLAIVAANFARSWTFYLMLTSQPRYFRDSFGMDLTSGTILGSLPHLLMAIVVPIGGQLADLLRRREILSTTNVRKLFNCGGFGLEALFLVLMSYAREQEVAIVFLTLAVGFSGFAISGFNVNHLDIAPVYSPVIMGVSNSAGTLAGMLCPLLVGQIGRYHGHDLRLAWRRVFVLSGVIHFVGVIFYGIFASGELQDWAKFDYDENKDIKCCEEDNLLGSQRGQRNNCSPSLPEKLPSNQHKNENNNEISALNIINYSSFSVPITTSLKIQH